MEQLKYFRTSIFQITSLICLLGYLLGVLNLHFSDKTNHCIMTYMYEYPQFVRIHFKDNIDYPAYGLFAYSEGRLTEKARKMRFDGIPVLYLPGNAGSHMQARSLASVALRKALSKVSYNEELTGFYGGTLTEQVEFAAKSIKIILDLYSSNKYSKNVPTHVIVIGHSMGGLVASRLLAYPATLLNTRIAITLAAPLEAPVILFDSNQDRFYQDMRYDWTNYVNSDQNISDIKMLISFGNGPRDLLVPSGMTSYDNSFISVLTTALPGAWVSPDHISIVWCKQVVMAINKYLFSLVDLRTQQIVEDMQFAKDKAKDFFVSHRSMTMDPSRAFKNATMVADAFWYEDNRRIYQVARPGIETMTYLMVRLVSFPQNRFVAIEGINNEDQDWVFGCNAKHIYNFHRYCKQATSLSELSRWTGAATNFGKRKLATINLHHLKKQHPDWTHVVVKVSPTKKPITLNIDINDHASRRIEVTRPSLLVGPAAGTIITKTEENSLYYEIILKGFNTLSEAYLLYVNPVSSCEEYHVSAEVSVPWAENHEYFHYFTHLKQSPMKIRLFKSNPNITLGNPVTEYVKITLLLDPKCSFTVSISASWYDSMAEIVRNFTPVLIPYIVGIVIMAAASNIYNLWNSGSCISIHTALDSEILKPYYVVLQLKLLFSVAKNIPFLTQLIKYSTFNNNELHWLIESPVVLLVYMVALGMLIAGAAVVLCVMAFSSQLDKLIFKIFWRTGISIGERVAYALRKVPMVLSGVMVTAVPMSCGAASLAIGAAFYAYMISKMFEDYFEDLVYKIFVKTASKFCRSFKRKTKTNANGKEVKWSNLKELEKEGLNQPKIKKEVSREAKDEELSNLNFHMMMFSIWMMVTLLNLPTLLAWARNFKYETKLHTDPSFTAGLILSACSGYIWQLDGPRKYLTHYTHTSSLLFTTGICVMVVGPFSLVVANYAAIAAFFTLTLQQLIDFQMNEQTHKVLYGVEEENEHQPTENQHNEHQPTENQPNEQGGNKTHVGKNKHNAHAKIRHYLNYKIKGGKKKNKERNSHEISNGSQSGTKDSGKQENTKPENIDTNEKPESNSDRETSQSGKDKSDNAGSSGNATNSDSTERCDPCDESNLSNVFKNLREKHSLSTD